MIGVPRPEDPPLSWRQVWSDSLRYWEPRRIPYNLVLACTVLACLGWRLPPPGVAWVGLVVAAGVANVCYCAAYLVDLGLQYSELRESWLPFRFLLWVSGTVFAACLAVLSLPMVLAGRI